MATTTSVNVNAPKNRMLGIALGAMVTIAAIAGASYSFGFIKKEPQAAAAPVAEIPIFIALEPFTVNLQSEGRPRFLHIGITLKAIDAKTQEQVTLYLPEVRSRVLMLLSNRKPESLSTQDDKNQLSAEILKTLNQPFSPGQVSQQITNVVFTAFVLQ